MAYPSADLATRETIGSNAFLDAIPGPAVELRLNVLRGRPSTILEAVALALEVDAVLEAETSKKVGRSNHVHSLEPRPIDHQAENEQLAKLTQLVSKLERRVDGLANKEPQRPWKQAPKPPSPNDRSAPRLCYNCGKPGHVIRDCRLPRQSGNEDGCPHPQ